MMLLARLTCAALAAALLATAPDPALACSCDKEARIKKYGTLRLVQEAEPPSTPAAPVTVPAPASSSPGS